MKLRNKKTGEIVDVIGIACLNGRTFFRFDDGEAIFKFEANSLSELEREWKDVETTEPLIKDEKIRKAVRAWAEANDITRCHYEYGEFEQEYGELCAGISFGRKTDFLEERLYTIAELCGEEEE